MCSLRTCPKISPYFDFSWLTIHVGLYIHTFREGKPHLGKINQILEKQQTFTFITVRLYDNHRAEDRIRSNLDQLQMASAKARQKPYVQPATF